MFGGEKSSSNVSFNDVTLASPMEGIPTSSISSTTVSSSTPTA
jgi:hypothetical protein